MLHFFVCIFVIVFWQRMDELEDAIGALKDMAVDFTCLMFEKTQAVLKGAMHMVW